MGKECFSLASAWQNGVIDLIRRVRLCSGNGEDAIVVQRPVGRSLVPLSSEGNTGVMISRRNIGSCTSSQMEPKGAVPEVQCVTRTEQSFVAGCGPPGSGDGGAVAPSARVWWPG